MIHIIAMGDTSTIILTFLIVILIVVLIYLLAMSYFKERKRKTDEKALTIEGILTKNEMDSLISTYLTRSAKDVQFGLIYIDLDKFTDFINAFGKDESEQIIAKIAKNIERVLPHGVKIARVQNDEFLIFFTQDYDRSEIVTQAHRIKQALQKPIRLYGDTDIKSTASIAVAFYPAHGHNLKDLINSLLLATYIIKRTGGNNIRIYSEEMTEQGGEYVEYYYQIKHAISHKEFQLYYHPMINVKTKTLFGVESLIRWNHPEHGLLSPFKFLGIMEQSGDIHWITLWGLETIIKTQQEISQYFPKEKIKFSMNIGPKQLMSETITMDMQKILKKYKAQATNFILEIIEFAVFEKQETILKNLKTLKQMGFQIAIDGFGLDYQTLSKVTDLKVDIIKLDNEFLKEDEDYMKSKFAKLLVDFANENDTLIICEMIENKEMLDKAIQYGIDIHQGYYFTKPLSAESLRGYIGTEAWDNVL
ncbi:MAG: bifunctional diguanylate cyclase/phosphodiesterase [Acholeplasmataceae bacterium]